MESCIAYCDSPLGPLLLVARRETLVGLYFADQRHCPRPDPAWTEDPGRPPLRDALAQLAQYFAGARTRFELPLAPRGSPFQRSVWRAIAGVGYGQTISYGELARRTGGGASPRAVGAATGQNPIGIIVPCHRIVGADGSLTGYAGGLERKRALLALEAEHARTDLLAAVAPT
jgi:methylated-DNA-[protein]-cysteine S-methyltransferase